MAKPIPPKLSDLARKRLALLRLTEEETEEMKRLRAEGNILIGNAKGYVVLPVEKD
jgi:hypothetical protein